MKTCSFHKAREYKIIRYFLCSLVVTGADYLIFFSLSQTFHIIISNIISYSIAICLSFYLQKIFVFNLQVKIYRAFIVIILFSLIAVFLSTVAVVIFDKLFGSILAAKILTTITMFFYNYISKKMAFGDPL